MVWFESVCLRVCAYVNSQKVGFCVTVPDIIMLSHSAHLTQYPSHLGRNTYPIIYKRALN